MDFYLADLSFGFIKKFDLLCDPYFIRAPDS
jgi:hypothetical protein